jgi:hypothetical protein
MFRTSRTLDVILIVIMIAFAIHLLIALPGGGREGPRRAKCSGNLKQIWYGCDLFAKDNAGVFPADLVVLYRKYISDKQLFVCPTVQVSRFAAGHGAAERAAAVHC